MSKRTQKVRKPSVASAQAGMKAQPVPTNQFPLLWLITVVIITGIVFWPMLHNQFTNWDDEAYVVNNELLRGPDWAGIFSRPVVSNYHPLTILSLALNYQVSKLTPFSYLLANWAVHLVNTGLVFYLVWLLSGKLRWVALFSALVFALHPMHVESVAWVSERKDVLYTSFYLLALIRYWQYLDLKRSQDYGLTLAFFALSLLSKPAAVVLPLSLLLLDFWKGRKWERRVWMEKIPFFALSLLFGVITLLVQSEKALVSLEKYTLVDRVFFGCYGLLMYIIRFFVPAPLSAFHPYPASGELGWGIRLAPVALLALGAVIWYFRRNKALVFGTLFYAVNIILVVQFVAIGNTLLSERYTYVPYIGLAFALAMTLATRNQRPSVKFVQWSLAVLVAVIFGLLSSQRARVWQNSETLWTDAIDTYPNAPIPRSNRANYLYQQAMLPAHAADSRALMARALADCNVALQNQPGHFGALDIRSIIYLRTGQYDAALTDANAMIQAKPADAKGYLVRGSAYEHQKRYEEALSDYGHVLEIDPDNAEALNGRGTVLFNGKKQYREALADFDRAVAIKPDPRFYLNRSRCYLMLGDKGRALEEAQTAQRLGGVVAKDYMDLLRQ